MSLEPENVVDIPVAEDFSEPTHRRRTPSRHYYKWIIFSPLSMILVSSGICVIIEAYDMKSHGSIFVSWLLMGLAGLILLNIGLAFLGESIKSKIMLDLRKKRSKSR
jgi:hypothetical protein